MNKYHIARRLNRINGLEKFVYSLQKVFLIQEGKRRIAHDENGNLINNWIGKNFFGNTKDEVVELALQDLEAIILNKERMIKALIKSKKESCSQNVNSMIVGLILYNQKQLNSFKESFVELKNL